jgi:uncharacterized delta-60 repeat protein
VGLQSDGKILVAGSASSASGDVFALARYTTSGGLDSTFGSGGKVTTSFGRNTQADAGAMAVQGDAKIVLAGYAYNRKTGWNFALARYNTNGSLDTSFGSGGLVNTAISANYGPHDQAVVVQSDGKVVMAGVSFPSGSSAYHITLARFNANGTLDVTFGNAGVVVSQVGNGNSDARAVALQGDGKIVVGGWIVVNNQELFAVARYNANGTLDTTFGNGAGYAGFSVGTSVTYDGAYSLLIQPADGKIVAGGAVQPPSQLQNWELARFNTDGTSDPTFGGTGVVDLPSIPGNVTGLALQPDGKIVAAGVKFSPNSFELGRFNPDGSLDTTFNGTGLVNTQIGTSSRATGVVIQPTDGKIIVAGSGPWSSSGPAGDSFALARYLASSPHIGSFTASSYTVASGSSVTLTASSITDVNPGSSTTQVAIYLDSNGDGKLEPGSDTLLGYATQTSPGVWTFTYTVSLAPGSYTLFAQAEDNYSLFSDPLAVSLQVL